MNNAVKDGRGNIVGFRCFECGDVFNSMWGTTCNGCRNKQMGNNALREEIQKLTEVIKNLKK